MCLHLMKGGKGKDFAVLILRLMLGVVFIYHGAMKLMAISATAGFFASVHIPMANIMAPLVGVVEVATGVMMILGMMTSIAAWLMTFTMLGAIGFVHIGNGFSASKGGYEFALTLLVMAQAVLHLGHGKYSVCKCEGKDGVCGTCKADA